MPIETVQKIGGDGKRGYNLYSIPASFSRRLFRHTDRQVGEEIELTVINAQDLNTFKSKCSLDERRG